MSDLSNVSDFSIEAKYQGEKILLVTDMSACACLCEKISFFTFKLSGIKST